MLHIEWHWKAGPFTEVSKIIKKWPKMSNLSHQKFSLFAYSIQHAFVACTHPSRIFLEQKRHTMFSYLMQCLMLIMNLRKSLINLIIDDYVVINRVLYWVFVLGDRFLSYIWIYFNSIETVVVSIKHLF